jgi:hypothetical protein
VAHNRAPQALIAILVHMPKSQNPYAKAAEAVDASEEGVDAYVARNTGKYKSNGIMGGRTRPSASANAGYLGCYCSSVTVCDGMGTIIRFKARVFVFLYLLQ